MAEITSVDASTAEPETPRSARPGGFGTGAGAPRSSGARGPGRGVDLSSAREGRGTVKWYNPEKGFGFITPDGGGEDLFMHRSALEQARITELAEGTRVRITVTDGKKGPTVSAIQLA